MNRRERVLKALDFEEVRAMDLGGMLSTGISCFAYPHLVAALGLPPRKTRVHDTYQMLALPDPDVLDALDCDVVAVGEDQWTNAFEEPGRWHDFDFNGRLDGRVLYPDGFSIGNDGTVFQNEGRLRMPPSSFVFDELHGGEPLDIMDIDPPKEDPVELEKMLRNSLYSDERIISIRNYCRRAADATDRAVFFNGPGMGLLFRGGMASWSMFCLTDKDYVREIHELITKYVIMNFERLLPEIAPYIDIYMSNADDQGTQNATILPPAIFRELYVPYYKRMNDALHRSAPGVRSFLHTCGGIFDIIDDVIDAGFDVLNPVQWSAGGHSFKEWKDKCRNRIALWGGGVNSQATLPLGSVEEVRTETEEVCRYMKTDGGFVFNSIHNILAEISPDKVIAMYESAGNVLSDVERPVKAGAVSR